MKCDNCGSANTYVKDYNHVYTIKGKEIEFVSKRRFCEECNALVYDNELDDLASEKAISIYNAKYGISKEEIISLRNKYNLSQELFSRVIGCAKKTLISYEKGKSIPNDSYLIILKSLILKPETILTLIDANKEQFTNKEYNKISCKLQELMPNNTKKIAFNIDESPNEYNGYTKFSKEKLYNMILFFADKKVLKTKLLKELFYTDFLCYKDTCSSMSGLEYSKLPYGPVPDQFEYILNQCSNDDVIDYKVTFIDDYEYNNICARKKFDKTLFSDEEIKIMNKVKTKFKSFCSKDIVDYSHKEKAFIKTEFYDRISYDFAFDINFE